MMLNHTVVYQITSLLIGFSIFACLLLLVAYVFFLRQMRKSAIAIGACTTLLSGLGALQVAHYFYLINGTDFLSLRWYGLLLLIVPCSFYFFGTYVLMPDRTKRLADVAHFVPLAMGLIIPVHWNAPIAFSIGTVYSLWFMRIIYRLRTNQSRFRFEVFFFGLFASLAIMILLIGIFTPSINHQLFYLAYANATSLALLVVITGLIAFPELLTDIAEAANIAYASSTLGAIDNEVALARLQTCMTQDKRYEDENLNLSSLAEACDLTGHQLSELINTSFGIGFSRYIRQQRVAEAKRLLIEDSRSSVLSIGLATGFKSQSAFYAAFREETGEAPGRFRKSATGK